MRLYAATGDAIARIDADGGGWRVSLSLVGSGAQCLAVDPQTADTVFAGLREHGVRRSRDGGASWEDMRFPQESVFSVAVSAADGAVYVGCEPSALFRSDDGGGSWRELRALLELPSRPTWSFPPRPWTSHVRWIAPSPHDGGTVLVGIELGGLMRSSDGGATWDDHRPGAQPDVHSLAWHPRDRLRAYEAGGGGTAWSFDAGDNWQRADTGRDRHYAWSVAPDPEDPDCWFVSVSTGPRAAHRGRDPEAGIYRWRGDGPWTQLDEALPEPLDAMPYALTFGGSTLFAALANGRILASDDRGTSWHELALVGDPLTSVYALVAA